MNAFAKNLSTVAAILASAIFLLLAASTGALAQTERAETASPVQTFDDTSGRLGHILQRGRLIVGVKSDYAPWGMFGEDGEIIGLEPDLARDVADRLGVGLELVSVSASNRLRLLEQGRIDLVIATMGDTEERRGISDLLQPHYYSSGVRLLAPEGSLFTDWGQLRGRTICLVEGAYFNRVLTERFLLDPLVFTGNRDAMLALQDGRCVGWAFDDTVLSQIIRENEAPGLALSLPTIVPTPWTIAVRKGERDAPFGQFVADTVADWHREGTILALQDTWGLPQTDFLARYTELWSAEDENGALICQRGPDGAYPESCLSDEIAYTGAGGGEVPEWAQRFSERTGLSLDIFFDSYARGQLTDGVLTTVLLSVLAIIGSLVFGVLMGWVDALLSRRGVLGWILRLPLLALFSVARMTPPILQLYLIFFALGAFLITSYAAKPGAFLTAAFVFSLYAGSANAVQISGSLLHLSKLHPGDSLTSLLPRATERVFDSLMASCINIVKAAGMASTIAVAEVVSASNTLIAAGGDARAIMNFLLIFYFFFVLFVVFLFRLMRLWLIGRDTPIAEPAE